MSLTELVENAQLNALVLSRFARPSAVLSMSMARHSRIAYNSLACAAALFVYLGHSSEKKHVCDAGRWSLGRGVSSAATARDLWWRRSLDVSSGIGYRDWIRVRAWLGPKLGTAGRGGAGMKGRITGCWGCAL